MRVNAVWIAWMMFFSGFQVRDGLEGDWDARLSFTFAIIGFVIAVLYISRIPRSKNVD